ncbi:hypothetical protein [Kitasatospora sp. NPDC015120]|uniref:hypothetical protein n=1 Tax=Kitasatospora sp. NPDC015120 TaxID=3364023 RepID=UPI0036F4615D
MTITISVTNPTPEVLEHLLAIASAPGATVSTVPDDRWTPERARAYYDRLPPRARDILHAAVRKGGRVQVDEVRVEGKSLRGTTGPFRQVLREGARTDPPLWPAALPVPVRSVRVGAAVVAFDMIGGTDEEDPVMVFGKVLGFRVEGFRADGTPVFSPAK